jgi:cell division protein FtsI/penicillin-binding protein 2
MIRPLHKPFQIATFLVAVILWTTADLPAASLMGPAIDAFLHNHTRDGEISCVLSEAGGREVIYSDWPDFDRPAPLGSLVKPFAALAYAESHGGRFPHMECTPQSACWLPSGHGALGIEQAIAVSCNAYFRSLTEQLQPQDMARVTARFGLAAPPRGASTAAYFGLGNEWQLAPVALVRAYEELVKRADDPVVGHIVAGLKASAARGTVAGVDRALGGRNALGKTGTAPCVHHAGQLDPSNGDGYALVLYPAEQPRYTLFVRMHGVPGRRAANLAGEILRVVVDAARTSDPAKLVTGSTQP